MGAVGQLDMGRKYLTERFEAEPGRMVGLRARDAMDRSIPGNHDHWPGSWLGQVPQILGAPSARLRDTFRETPWKQELLMELGGHPVRMVLVGINSDDEVWPWGPSRLFARGRFQRQVEQAARLFGLPHRDEVRVLLVHHTRHVDGFATSICRRSRDALEQLIAECDVATVLTGHLHEPRASTIGTCPEICAGTTTQLDEPPSSWNISDAEMSRFRDNTLCVHQIAETADGGIEWHTAFERRRETGFVRVALPAMPPFRVWPRAQ